MTAANSRILYLTESGTPPWTPTTTGRVPAIVGTLRFA